MDELKDFLTAPSIILNDDDETAELINQAIFSMGTHKDIIFTRDDIDEMVENFYTFSSFMRIPAKLGHGNDNYGTRNGYPAVGLVKEMRREGPYLIADFTKVPIVVAKAIQRNQFMTKSSEILLDYDWGFSDSQGREVGPVVLGVAFLGEEIPAVPDLNDLDTLFNISTSEIDFSKVKSFSLSFKHEEEKNDSENVKPESNNKIELNDGYEDMLEDELEEINKNKEFSENLNKVVVILDSIESDESKIEDHKDELDKLVLTISDYDPQKDFNDFWNFFKQINQLRSFAWISEKMKKLGYEIPESIENFNNKKNKEDEDENSDSSKEINNNNSKKEDFNMDKDKKELDENVLDAITKATEAITEKFSTQITDLTEKLDKTTTELNETKTDLVTKEAENSKMNSTMIELAKNSEIEKERHMNAQIDQSIAGWVKDGKVVPRQVIELKALLKSSAKVRSKVSFSHENAEGKMEDVEKSSFELVNDIINGFSKQVDFKETAIDEGKEVVVDARTKARDEAKEIAENNKKEYKS